MIRYLHCTCRDCFEIAIGGDDALCWSCEEARCAVDKECQAESAYSWQDDDNEEKGAP